MRVSDRLSTYYEFDADILSEVEEVANRQNRLPFRELAEQYNLGDGPKHPETNYKSIEVLTLRPAQDYDEHHARIYHTPMAMPVSSMAMRAIRLFASDPTEQLIVVGNPAAVGNQYNKLRLRDLRKVGHGNLEPTVEPHLAYLESIGVTSTDQIGFSWGAEKAAAASGAIALDHDISVNRGVWMEPVAVVNRGMWKLLRDFKSAEPELENYVRACSAPENDVDENDSWLRQRKEFIKYAGGLLRPSNLAIEQALAHDGFIRRVRKAMTYQPDINVTIAWGTASELVPNEVIQNSIDWLRSREHSERSRIGQIVLKNMHHAGGDDIDLHAAIVLQGLRQAA